MNRRNFVKSLLGSGITVCTFGLVGCGKENGALSSGLLALGDDRVTMYDTYAMALYMDGGLGPKTGVCKVDYVIANKEVTLDFWHGHNGQLHHYTITPAHFALLKKGRKVTIETTKVADHTHKLFIDPVDKKWRVAGAPAVQVPDEA